MISLWNNGRKGATYNFIDRHISNFMRASGTGVYLHKYLGVDDGSGDPSLTAIQDVVYLENRNRKYSAEVFELRGTYNVQDVDFDMRSFGIFLANDTIFIEFHLNDMIALLGRKIMSGDVIELPHQRDADLLDPDAKPMNRYYVVQDGNRAASGYSSTWHPHIWRVKMTPMTGAVEYADLLDKQALDPFGLETGTTLRDIMTTTFKEMEINEAVVEEAKAHVSKRYFETRQFHYVPGSDTSDPWIFAGDGVPPNGAELLGSGNVFPAEPQEGDYFLRTDYKPQTLFQFENTRWSMREVNHRTSGWSAANRLLADFLDNTNKTELDDGTLIDEKVALSKAVKYRPDADF